MTELNKTNVKKTLTKLNLEIILRLLLSCKKDYQLFADNDVNSPRKELSIHRQALINYIIDATNEDHEKIYKKAKAIAESLAEHDEKIQIIKEEIKPIKNDLDTKKDKLNSSVIDKELAIEYEVIELHDGLDDAAKNKLVQYKAVVEKVAVNAKNKKQMEKTLGAVADGFFAADNSGLTKEFGEAIFETSNVSLSFIAKMRTRIKEHKESNIDFNTIEGINTVNKEFKKKWPTHLTEIINKTGLNSDWTKTEEVPAQKLLMPAEGEVLAIAA